MTYPAPIVLLCCLFLYPGLLRGQTPAYYTAGKRTHRHYIHHTGNEVIVYRMGGYLDKAGTGPSVLSADTLYATGEGRYTGKQYTWEPAGRQTLTEPGGRRLIAVPEADSLAVVTLNEAYLLDQYAVLSNRLNTAFPLYHYSFRNGFTAWRREPEKNLSRSAFITRTNQSVARLYDSISRVQAALSATTAFIQANASVAAYTTLRDSLATLPAVWRSESGYFDISVRSMVTAVPEYYYKLLQDFPEATSHLYTAVSDDKELVQRIGAVPGYEEPKKALLKNYRQERRFASNIVIIYAIAAAVVAALIVAQP